MDTDQIALLICLEEDCILFEQSESKVKESQAKIAYLRSLLNEKIK